MLSGLASEESEAEAAVSKALDSGRAAEVFAAMVAALGGPADFLTCSDAHLPAAPLVRPVFPHRNGLVVGQDTRAIGMAVVAMGGGRLRADQAVDHAVGFSDIAGIGEEVGPERPLAILHARGEETAAKAEASLRAAFKVGGSMPEEKPLIHDRIAS